MGTSLAAVQSFELEHASPNGFFCFRTFDEDFSSLLLRDTLDLFQQTFRPKRKLAAEYRAPMWQPYVYAIDSTVW